MRIGPARVMVDAGVRRLRRLAKRAVHARELRARRPPRLVSGTDPRRAPVVYYLTPDDNSPRGGVRVNYRHVDLLNAGGIEAAVLHTRTGFRCDWFANETRVVGASDVTLHPDDVLVVPEIYATGFGLLPAGPRKLVFNQGPYYTFNHIPFTGGRPGAPYTDVDNVVGILTVSADGAALLRYTFPTIPVHLARSVIDGRRFHPGGSARSRRIAYVPRRRPHDRDQLLHTLHARGVLDGWELVPIEGRTEDQVADLMRDAAIFLSFSERDGFGLPPAEAMACGCYVVGFTGGGGRDYFDAEYCTPVADGDLLAFARSVEEAVRRYDTDPDGLAKAGLLASERILGRYHADGLRDDLLDVYRPLLADRRNG